LIISLNTLSLTDFQNLKESLPLELLDLPGNLDQEMEIEIEDDDINTIKTIPPLTDTEIPTSEAINVFNNIIVTSIENEVTDIHIEPDGDDGNIRIRLREGGECRIYDELSDDLRKSMTNHIKSQSDMNLDVKQLPQTGSFRWQEDTAWTDMDIVTYPTIGNAEDIMLRLTEVKRTPVYIQLEQMNFSEPNLECVEEQINRSHGLCVVTGAHGIGYTTTLHALAGEINVPEKKIITIEDPVEIVQGNLRQIQINHETGLIYENVIRPFMGNSPDALMVGDLIEAKTVHASLEAAKQFLIIVSFNAESPIECISELLKTGANPSALADTLSVIIGQKLVRTLCNECKTDYHPTSKEFESLANFYGKKYFPELGVEYNADLKIKQAVGYKKCLSSGYETYTSLHEVMEVTDDLKSHIVNGVSLEEIEKQAIKDGKISLAQDGIYIIFKGDCDFKKLKTSLKKD